MKLLHYMPDNEAIGREYVVLTDNDKPTKSDLDGWCRPGFTLTGSHDVEPSNNYLPVEIELKAS